MSDFDPEETEDYVSGGADDPRWWNREFELERRIQEAERRHHQRVGDPEELDGFLRWPGDGGRDD